ncbi:FERM domain-containing protein 6-like isoform X2 [Varroa destructor]|nr:FERM domain-containing protein 6-like isoform X2 [Varroa destructor]XP_022658436.1 FERM domain-containing protein 6-like isoform X2 [Varroa destructor]XP_022658437.1 FERM domain-containing protein 6-like isoform X2 [Varroa destructor]XP_022658438.1 FERM domain-containing protein 6-like isoform X2 [Varroa destructor]XP_022658439.1 FERM domain-containing protein 6-like isoform X2 [Varroa destructor]XP_022658441.1 FERM domain-containing protein 6-like isoform X2 [Varroa destructor]XP_02265844
MGRNLRSVFTRCDAPLPLGRKYVAIKLLTNQTLYFAVELKCTVQDIFDQLCCYLGIVDSQLFGLAKQVQSGAVTGESPEFCFVEQGARLAKLAPKGWKGPTSAGLDGHGRPLITLHLRVQYFVDCMMFVQQDRVACQHYYQHVRANLLAHDWAMSQEKAFILASLALQADLGNYDPARHRGRYFQPNQYFPWNIVQTVGESFIVANLPLMHRDHRNLNRGSAQLAFIKESQEFAMHVYRVQQKKSNFDFTLLGVSAQGIQVYQPITTPVLACQSCNVVITRETVFPWSDISKLTFDRRRFEVRLEGRCRQLLKFVYNCPSEAVAGSILELCKRTHQFNMVMQPRLAELRNVERRNRVTKYRESYICEPDETVRPCVHHGGTQTSVKSALLGTNALNSALSRHGSPALSGSDPRISVISSSSSNTTSGVMSDKPQSPESEEEDDSPAPAAVSLESLPSSHLNKDTSGGYSDYGTLENLNKKALSEHNLSYHNKLLSAKNVVAATGGHRGTNTPDAMQSYVITNRGSGYSSRCLASTDEINFSTSLLKSVPETSTLDKAISLDNIALANASFYHHHKPQTDLRIAVSYVDAMKANSEEYLSDSCTPQKATPLYLKNPHAQLRGAPQPATRSTSFAGHQKPRPPPVKPRTKIGISSLSRNPNNKVCSEPELLHLAKSQCDLTSYSSIAAPAASVNVSSDSLDSADVLDEVRLKSSQHNLPFMSALCQDRSLIPKTVPNLRQNPTAGINDSRRFSYCSYLLADSPRSLPAISGGLFKFTSLGNMALTTQLSAIPHPPAPLRQMIPHKLSQENNNPNMQLSHRKAVVF